MSLLAMPVHVAIVDDTGQLDPAELAAAAAALNHQLQRDVRPIWHVSASVGAYPAAPPGTWVIHLQAQLDQPDALGYHTDAGQQPVAYVEITDQWSVTLSHEGIEMVVDPWGNRLHPGLPPQGLDDQLAAMGLQPGERVQYLVEACDPCEATSYDLGAVAVSDFLLPSWYLDQPRHPESSYAWGCMRPREVVEGGYVSFATQAGEWWQLFVQDGVLQVQDLGRFDAARFGSLREFTDHHARTHRASGTAAALPGAAAPAQPSASPGPQTTAGEAAA
jgi:hypothetical protein